MCISGVLANRIVSSAHPAAKGTARAVVHDIYNAPQDKNLGCAPAANNGAQLISHMHAAKPVEFTIIQWYISSCIMHCGHTST